MVKKRKVGWTTISVPISLKDRLAEYALPRESWEDTILRLLKEVDEYKLMKERYKLR